MVIPAAIQHGLRAPSRSIRYVSGAVEPTPVQAPPLGPPIVLQQMDVVSDHLNNVGASGLVPGAVTENIELQEGGTPGTVDLFFQVRTEAIRAHVFMESQLNEPNEPLWQAGTWTVRMNVTGTVGNNARIRSCYVFRVDSVGVTKWIVASTEDLNIACSQGLKTWSMTGIETNGAASDRILIVIGMNRTTGTVTVRIRPNQAVNTPILRAA